MSFIASGMSMPTPEPPLTALENDRPIKEVDLARLEANAMENGLIIERLISEWRALSALEAKLVAALEEAQALIHAKDGILACYRLGKHPSESLFEALGKSAVTNRTIQDALAEAAARLETKP
jgi:hypothetical protein